MCRAERVRERLTDQTLSAHTHTRTHMHAHTRTHANIHTHTHTRAHTRTHAHRTRSAPVDDGFPHSHFSHTQTHTDTHTHMHMHTHTHADAPTHTYIHTHTHIARPAPVDAILPRDLHLCGFPASAPPYLIPPGSGTFQGFVSLHTTCRKWGTSAAEVGINSRLRGLRLLGSSHVSCPWAMEPCDEEVFQRLKGGSMRCSE